MPRTLPAAIDNAITQDVTEPVYLIETAFNSPTYWTTSRQVTWDGKTWIGVGIRVQRFGSDQAVLLLSNQDSSGSATVLNDGVRDRLFTIYEHHAGDAVEVFRGYGGDVTVTNERTVINLHANRRDRAVAPRRRVNADDFNYLPRPGSKISWGDTVITVETK